jgi:hypothetical protein
MQIANRFFCREEAQELASLPEGQQQRSFFLDALEAAVELNLARLLEMRGRGHGEAEWERPIRLFRSSKSVADRVSVIGPFFADGER